MKLKSDRFYLYTFLIANLFIIKISANDDMKFELNWLGESAQLQEEMKKGLEIIEMTTINSEKYKCVMPSIVEDQKNQNEKDTSNEKIQTSKLLDEIYNKKFCSYRIESYWIYELCHGQHIRQYHETKSTGKRTVTDSYFLGKFDQNIQEPDYLKENEYTESANIHWRTLGGNKVPTYAVKYVDGTLCEVSTNVLRETTVFYACSENGNDNIAHFEEISSCIYEMIVVTKSICSHPSYQPSAKNQKNINCYALENAPIKPIDHTLDKLDTFGTEDNDENHRIKMTDRDGSEFIVHYQNNRLLRPEKTELQQKYVEDDQENKDDNDDDEDEDYEINEEPNIPTINIKPKVTLKNADSKINTDPKKIKMSQANHEKMLEAENKAIIKTFLSGDKCLRGGNGWWKFEICYGKHVMQYHEDERTSERTNVLIGTWDQNEHLKWIEKNHKKKPLLDISKRTYNSLLYSNGQPCEGLNRNRQVEIKFRCKPKKEGQSHAVSLYLLEPSTCEYLLGIESPWFCNFVKTADQNGIPTSLSVEDTIE